MRGLVMVELDNLIGLSNVNDSMIVVYLVFRVNLLLNLIVKCISSQLT